MIPLIVGAVIAAGQIITSVVGGIQAGKQREEAQKKAQEAMNNALAIIDQTGAPPDLSHKIMMQQFEKAGLMTPAVEQAITAGISKAAQISEDPSLKEAQTGALRSLSERGRLGLSAEDRMALNKVRAEAGRNAEGKRQQILQNFAARGQGGSGSELIAALNDSQNSANQASEQGDRVAAQASMNALQAMSQAGQLGGQIRAQDFDVASSKARAEDEMRKFDIQNRIGTQQRNTERTNAANQYNVTNAQSLSNANTQMNNAESLRQNEAKRQRWLDQLNLNMAKSNIMTGQANQQYQFGKDNAQGTTQMYQGISQGIGAIGGAMGGMGGAKPPMGGGGAAPEASAKVQDNKLYPF